MKKPRHASEPHVAICVNKARAFGRGLLQGVADYVAAHGPWSIFLDPYATGTLDRDWLRRWEGDGMLTYVGDRAIVRRLVRSRIPLVEVYGTVQDDRLPHVGLDDAAVGRIAADHLIDREFRHFAYCGHARALWSRNRHRGFRERLQEAGFDCMHFDEAGCTRTPGEWERAQQALARWLDGLPRPMGLLASTDLHAQRILDACRRAGRSVPEEIAVLGVDNDEELCRLSNPPLSSVINDPRRVGFEAARLLDRLMSGQIRAGAIEPVLVPPLGVMARQSTDITAIDDPDLADALSYIRKHACEGIRASDVATAIACSRATLYRRFETIMGRSPNDEILRVQLERAKALLTQTSYPLDRIARLTGFSTASYLSVAFKREHGMRPGEYRQSASPAHRID